MTSLIVTGASGQLGQALQRASGDIEGCTLNFFNKEKLDITDPESLDEVFKKGKYDYCINCAAYSQVDSAEKHPGIAHKVNSEGVSFLAECCNRHGVILIHISTDFVFDGGLAGLYTEADNPSPLNEYGRSKLEGEKRVETACKASYIIRTSWLYSQHGNNFVKAIIRSLVERDQLEVVNDQHGCPTNAADLVNFILMIVKSKPPFGLYHYCNKGKTSRYDFALEIKRLLDSKTPIQAINSARRSDRAARPENSALSVSKAEAIFDIEIPDWKESLKRDLESIKNSLN